MRRKQPLKARHAGQFHGSQRNVVQVHQSHLLLISNDLLARPPLTSIFTSRVTRIHPATRFSFGIVFYGRAHLKSRNLYTNRLGSKTRAPTPSLFSRLWRNLHTEQVQIYRLPTAVRSPVDQA